MNSLLQRAGKIARLTRRRRDGRSVLEAALRSCYDNGLAQWDADADTRLRARVARELAVARLERACPPASVRRKIAVGPHIAAIVCAGAAIVAFSTVLNVNDGPVSTHVTPTSGPSNPHRPAVFDISRFSSGTQTAANLETRL